MKIISISLPEQTVKKLSTLSKKERRTRSAFINELILNYERKRSNFTAQKNDAN